MRAARVVGEAERGQAPAADDAEAGPEGPVGAGEGDRDVERAGVEVGVAEQGDAVDRDRDQGRQRERLVQRPHVAAEQAPRLAAAADHHPDPERAAGEHHRRDPGRPAGDPEDVRPDRGQEEEVTIGSSISGSDSNSGSASSNSGSDSNSSNSGAASSASNSEPSISASASGAGSRAGSAGVGSTPSRARVLFRLLLGAQRRVVAARKLHEDDPPEDREQRQRAADRAAADRRDAQSPRARLGAGEALGLELANLVHRQILGPLP